MTWTTGERPLPASDELFDEARRPNFWSKLTGFQNRFRLMCYARALLDWTLTIIEPTVDNGFCEFRNFSIPAIKSSVSTLGDKRIKEITSLERKSMLGFLKDAISACLLTGYGKSLIYHLSSTSGRRVICCLQLQGSLLCRTSDVVDESHCVCHW